jgi:ATP-dependent Lhr-like helicase
VPGVLDGFHPAVRAWFLSRFDSPSRAQQLGWPVIGEAQSPPGHDVLLCAPTGSGKTLAAFMWAINRLVIEAESGSLSDEVSVLYVSPLKALANDIRLNLEEPLEGVRGAAERLGIALAPIRAGLRTGDTPANERSAMLRRPPHILVTTPESLFILLTSPRFRTRLASVRYVIVDELHAIAGNKRGAHLAATLERLERMLRLGGKPRPARIGLSATLNPVERLAEFLAGGEVKRDGTRTLRAVKVVRADDRLRAMDLKVLAPGPDLGPLATHEHWEAMYDEAARLIAEHRTTLVFTLSRRWAERVALNLQKRLGADAVMAHHGSLARKERLAAEQRLKRGELRAIVATASLELGIDVGAVDLVCQVDSPKSISAAIQRIGRSGHSLGATPKGRFFALTLDDLLECASCVRAIRAGRIDEVEIPAGCLDVAAQQIVAIAAEEDEIAERDLLEILRGAYNFANLDDASLGRLLSEMAAEPRERIRGAAPKIIYDPRGGRVRARRGARMAAITSGGTIPENGNYDVVIESEGRKIGDVEEDFAQESSRGDIFALGSMPWQIQRISRGRLMVEPAPGMAPTLPFWQTEAAGRSRSLSDETTELRRELATRLERGAEAEAIAYLGAECLLTERAARQAVDYVRRGVAALGAVPDRRTVVVERFFDGLGGTQIVIHAPFGIRFNRGLGLAIRKRLCQSFDFEIQASAIDDGCLLALNARHSFPLEALLPMLSSRSARDVLVQALLNAPMFEVRFRHVATRALSVMRSERGRKVPPYIQRLRAQELLAALFPGQQACFENRPPKIEVPDHFILGETVRECLEESTDAAAMEEFLRGVENGSVRVVNVDAVSPSAFAHRLLLAWDYSFLDGGERANRRSRTVQMNRGMAEDVFHSEDLAQMLSRDVIDAVVADVTGLAPGRRARNRDELHELLRAHGSLDEEEIAARASGDSGPLVEQLIGERRLLRMRPDAGANALFVSAEDAPLYASAYPDARFDGRVAPGPAVERDAACREIVRRALATSGPVTLSELARRVGLCESEVGQAVSMLEAGGAIFRGHFISSSTEQWCDRYVLERVHRMTLARVRAEIEPAEDHEYARFLLRWHHVGGAGLEPDPHQLLRAVLEQLSGLAFAPDFWERAILPARIPGYRSEYLDLACMSGEFAWVAFAPEGEIAELPSKVAFVERRNPFPFESGSDDEPSDAKELAVWRALVVSGAQYLDEVAERAGLSERDTLAALWRLAARGRVSNDSFAPLRLFAAEPAAARMLEDGATTGHGARRDAALRARLKSSVTGRWSALTARKTGSDSRKAETGLDDRPREAAMLLLRRHGIVARETLSLETLDFSWPELQFALRRLEYAGTIRRGWFVRSLSGEQYALPEAAEMLRAVRGSNGSDERVVALSAADPANPYGATIAGCGIARDVSNVVVIRAGRVVLGLAGRAMLSLGAHGDGEFRDAIGALLAMRGKVVIDTVDERPALDSGRVATLAAIGFHSDGRALVYDGLPGPLPAKARAQSAPHPHEREANRR